MTPVDTSALTTIVVDRRNEGLDAFVSALDEAEVVKENAAKATTSIDAFVDGTYVQTKVKRHALPDGKHAWEFTRRRGDALAFALVLRKAQRFFGLADAAIVDVTLVDERRIEPCPEYASAFLPLLDMATMSPYQEEVAAGLLSWAVDHGPDVLCRRDVFETVRLLLSRRDVAVLYPTAKLIALLATSPRSKAFFDDALVAEIENVLLETRSRLVTSKLRETLARIASV